MVVQIFVTCNGADGNEDDHLGVEDNDDGDDLMLTNHSRPGISSKEVSQIAEMGTSRYPQKNDIIQFKCLLEKSKEVCTGFDVNGHCPLDDRIVDVIFPKNNQV